MEVFFGAHLFDGERMIEDAALVVDGGSIAAIVPVSERPRRARAHDLGGGVLSSGLIDWQVNGGGGVFFNETPTVDGIRAIAEAHRRHGTTGLLPTVITDRPPVLDEALAASRAAVGAIAGVLGIHVEGPFIDPRRPGAHPPASIRPMTRADADMLIDAKADVVVVTLAPTSVSDDLILRLASMGIIVSLGHAEASAEQASRAFAAGASATTHLFNAMSQLSGRTPGMVGSALADPAVICGLIADGHHVHETAIRVVIRAKGADGIALVSDAMPPAAGGPDTFLLQGRRVTRSGTRLVLDDGTLAGSATTLIDAVRWMTRELGIDLALALRMATLTPARLLRVDHRRGRLAEGLAADLVHLGDDLGVCETWIAGQASAQS